MKANVKDLVAGQEAIITGAVTVKKAKTKKKNEPYINLRIADATGSVFINVWQDSPHFEAVSGLVDGQKIEAHVMCKDVSSYADVNLLSFQPVQQNKEEVVDREALKNELRSIIEGMEDKQLRSLVSNVFKRKEVIDNFFTAPATLMSGYSFTGGLLAHVVRTAKLSKAIAEVANNWSFNTDSKTTKLNADLLVCASILHDVGKILAFKQSEYRIDKTMYGELFEDSYLTMRIINEEIEKAKLTHEKRLLLEHVIGSAKGKQGYGALHIPRTKEAILFHFIDAMDSQLANFEHLSRSSEGELFAQLFQKTFYLGDF